MVLANAVNSAGTGLQSLSNSGVFNGRTITGTANQISVSNGDGTAGNPTIALTSSIYVSGISFDSGSNTLSNYVEGTFNPTLTNTGSAPTLTYANQVGRYTRIGNRVILNITVTLSAYTAGTGNVQISSLPLTSNSTANNNSISSILTINTTFGASVSWYSGSLSPNVTSIDIAGNRTGTTLLNLDAAGPSATSYFRTSLVYEV